MMKNNALSRPALSAIAAFLALSTPAAFAQEAPTVTMTPPVPPTTVPVPAPAPTIAAPPATSTATPQPVIRVPLDLPPVEPAPKAAEPKAAAAPAPKRVAAKPREATPAPAAPREAAAPVAAASEPVLSEATPVAAPVPVPAEPVIETAPVAPVEQAAAGNDMLPWQIAGGAAALLLAGGVSLAFARRRRASSEVWDFDEARTEAEWVPGAAATVAEPAPEPIAPQTTPTFAAAPSGSMGRHEAMAMTGPTPENPFATLHKRLARARFLDRQERVAYEATLAEQKDMRRKPASAWEISQRETPAAPAEQEVRRLEPGYARKEFKPGWTRN